MGWRWNGLGAWVVAGSAVVAGADQPMPAPKGYVCGRAAAPIAIDGVIDDTAWASAPWTDDFVDIEGSKKPLPRFRTRAKMLWDVEYLYIAAELSEPHVWGNLTQHDSIIFQDNDFEVFLDPDGDNHDYFELEINALNTEWDLFLAKPYRDGGPADNSWEVPGLKKAVRVLGTVNQSADIDTGWTVELAIPWAALAQKAGRTTPPGDGDQWRINFSRVEWDTTIRDGKYVKVPKKPEDNWVWSPQGVIDLHQPEHWGYLQFSTQAPGKATYQPDPSGPIRDHLMTIYHAQKAFTKAKGQPAGTLQELGLDPDDFQSPGASLPVITPRPNGFEATITTEPRDGHPARTWVVNQDSKLTSSP